MDDLFSLQKLKKKGDTWTWVIVNRTQNKYVKMRTDENGMGIYTSAGELFSPASFSLANAGSWIAAYMRIVRFLRILNKRRRILEPGTIRRVRPWAVWGLKRITAVIVSLARYDSDPRRRLYLCDTSIKDDPMLIPAAALTNKHFQKGK